MSTDVVKKALVTAFLEQGKRCMKEHAAAEYSEDVNESSLKISINESDVQSFIDKIDEVVSIRATIACYCSKEKQTAAVACYFRGNAKFMSFLLKNDDYENAEEFRTCWNLYNLKRHFLSHSNKQKCNAGQNESLNEAEFEGELSRTLESTDVVEESVLDGQASVSQYRPIANDTTATCIILAPTKTFTDEPIDVKTKLVLQWIMSDKLYQAKAEEKIQNICILLNKMKYNGYLRLFEIDMSIVKKYMTDTSWTLFKDFEEKRKNDEWICPHCELMCKKDQVRWKCLRCLYWYHFDCSQPKEIKAKIISGGVDTYNLCFGCFFGM